MDTAWIRTYNGIGNGADVAYDLVMDDSGYIYVTGGSWGSPGNESDYTTIKYSPAGTQLWVSRYNGPGNFEDNAQAIAVDDSGNVYVTGISYGGSTHYDYATIKYNSNGDTAWVRRYNGPGNYYDYSFDIEVDSAGYIYVTGVSTNVDSSADYATIKYKQNGDTAWIRRYDGPGSGSDWAHALSVDNSGHVYVTGESYGTSMDYATIKYQWNGDTIWVRRYGSASYHDRAYDISIDVSGNVYVTGSSYGYYDDYITVKYYSDGDTAWTRRYNGPGNNTDVANAIIVDSCGNVYVTGRSTGSGTFYDYATLKYDSSGTQLWDARYTAAGNNVDEAEGVTVDDSGNVYVTGRSYSTDYDYATVKYDSDGNQRWVERYDSGHEPGDEAHAIAVDGYGNVYVTGGGYDYATIKYGQAGEEKIVVLRDGSDSLNPIADKTFKIYKVTNDPPAMTESYMGELTTNADGRITVPEGWFDEGEWVKVERLVHTEPAEKHKTIMPNMYYIKIDNGTFDSTSGAISYYSFTSDTLQEIIVDHATVMFDLLVSVEWDADLQFLESLRDGFELTSNYLYDVTDGQLYIDSLKIYDAKANWDSADVRIYASNMEWPHATIFFRHDGTPIRFGGGISGSGDARLYFPRIFYFNSRNGNRNLTYDIYPYDWTVTQTTYDQDGDTIISYPDEYKAYPPSRTLAHEFGHYGIGFRDEYIDDAGDRVLPDFDFGMMDNSLGVDVEQNSEMSGDLQYAEASHQVTNQWVTRGNRSCWDYFEWNYQGTYDGIFVPIKLPSTEMFWGPNNDMLSLNYDVGALLKTVISDSSTGAYVMIFTSTDELGSPLGNSNVVLYKDNHTWFIDQGNTADVGNIICLGVNGDDMIRAYRDTIDYRYVEIELNPSSTDNAKGLHRVSANGDTVVAVLRAVKGDYQMLNSGWYESENVFRYSLQVNKSFSQNPDLELYTPYEQMYTYSFSPVTEGYETSAGDSLGSDGMFSIIAVDDSAYSFFLNNRYKVTSVSDSLFDPEIQGPQAGCMLNLDPDNSSLQKILVISSDFPPLLSGLDSLTEQGGGVHSISAYPDISDLSGSNNYILIRYSDSDLRNGNEADLGIFKWDESLDEWEWKGGEVDTVRNEIVASVQSLGTYAAFTTSLLIGDVNGDGSLSVSDVVYLVNYLFKGGPPPVGGVMVGDVNCDTEVSVSDVVYLINYLFKGGPAPGC